MKQFLLSLFTFFLILACSKDSENSSSTPQPKPKFTVTISAGEGGSVNSSGGSYEQGSTISVTATAASGYRFVGWSNGETSTTLNITVIENISITANFERIEYSIDISGNISKGSFLTGSTLTFYELNNTLSQTGKSYNTDIIDNFGTYALSVEELTEDYARVVGEGYYWNEVNNTNTEEKLSLNAISEIKEGININVLTHLEYQRVIELVKSQDKSFVDAKKQALTETLSSLGIETTTDYGTSEQFNFKEGDEKSKILVVASAIIQAERTSAEVTELITTIANDLKDNGNIDNTDIKSNIAVGIESLDLNVVASNIYDRYKEDYPELTQESFKSNFLDLAKTEYQEFLPDEDNDGVWDGLDTCPDTPEGEEADENGCSKTQKQYQLTTTVEGEGSISEEIIEQTTASYDYGTTVRLTANPLTGWEFKEWTGGITSTENPIDITVIEEVSVTAVFVRKKFTLTTTIEGEGTVSVSPEAESYEYESTIELTATPSEGWVFSEWKGAAESSENPLSVVVDENKEITAVFKRKQYDLSINIEGEGAVAEEIVVQPSQYEYETQVKLTANSIEGWEFTGWSGDLEGTENPTTITIDKAKSITATFQRKQYSITTETSGSGVITITPQSEFYEFESIIQLSAEPSEGWAFGSWSGDIESEENPLEFSITNDLNIKANFHRSTPDLNAGTIDMEEDGMVPDFSASKEYTSDNPDGTWGVFGSDEWNKIQLEIVDNPNYAGNSSAKVLKIVEQANQEVWQGFFFDLESKVSLTEPNTAISVDVYSVREGQVVSMKLDDKANSATNTGDIKVATKGTGWETVTFNLSADYDGLLDRMVFIMDFGAAAETTETTHYIDNIRVSVPIDDNGDGNAPSEGPSAPTAAAADVISMFSDSYYDVTVDTWLTSWSNDGQVVTAELEDIDLNGNIVKKYSNFGFVGIETTSAPIDATSMTHINFDYWTADGTVFKIKLVDWGADKVWDGGVIDDTEHEIALSSVTQGEWVSVSIPLSDFTGMTARGAVTQYVLSAEPWVEATYYIDNMYFFNDGTGPADSDGDGVPDPADLCPDTPEGATVNANGCHDFIYVAENGVTIKARETAIVGDTQELDGETYKVVDETMLREMVNNDEDVTKVITTRVSDMSGLFHSKGYFNQDITSWDTSNVTDMGLMFRGASYFNKDISSWDVSNVTRMNAMFLLAESFNQNIDSWDVSSVTDMSMMFSNAKGFNSPIGSWDVSNVTNMSGMFRWSGFNSPIGSWDVSNVTNMSGMFRRNDFNQPIGDWDVSSVTDMSWMFQFDMSFNQDISSWDVSKVVNFELMFRGANSFNQDIGNWDISNALYMKEMFSAATKFVQDISSWCVSEITSEPTNMFEGSFPDELKPIWGQCGEIELATNGVTIIANDNAVVGESYKLSNDGDSYLVVDNELLNLKRNENVDMTKLVTSKVTSMFQLFANINDFNQDISSWDTSNVVNMGYLFDNTSFNQDISHWNTSRVTNMEYMFRGTPFNQAIENWDVSNVGNMKWMFSRSNFNQELNNWDVSNVTNMYYMFISNPSFNKPLNKWNTSNVTNMAGMFGSTTFNQDINDWDVSKVTEMYDMFIANESFNQDISSWDVSNVILVNNMFKNASAFNQDLSNWWFYNAEGCGDFYDGATSWTLPKPNFPKCNPN